MGLTLKVFHLILIYIMMRIIHSMSFTLSDRKLDISFIEPIQFDADILLDNETRDLITIEQRIKRCKDEYPNYDYDSLNEEEKDSLIDHSKINPCRCDCVVKEKNTSNNSTKKVIYTIFFADGVTKCGNRKVCRKMDKAGVCQIDTTLETTTVTNNSTEFLNSSTQSLNSSTQFLNSSTQFY